jgi:hypothetical protein
VYLTVPGNLRAAFFAYLKSKGVQVHERKRDRLLQVGDKFASVREAAQGAVESDHQIPELQVLTADFFKLVDRAVSEVRKSNDGSSSQ